MAPSIGVVTDSTSQPTPFWRSRTPWFVLALACALLAAGASFFLPKAGDPARLVPTLNESAVGPMGQQGRLLPGDPQALGPVDAPVVMVMFSDLLCPFCARFANETEPLLVEKYVDAGLLRIEWRDLLLFGEPSLTAARAARAAGEQGRFWEFVGALYAGAPAQGRQALTDARLLEIAQEAGVPDLERFESDRLSPAFDAAIEADGRVADGLGITGTPAFVINGHRLVGAQPFDAFAGVIDTLLQGSD